MLTGENAEERDRINLGLGYSQLASYPFLKCQR